MTENPSIPPASTALPASQAPAKNGHVRRALLPIIDRRFQFKVTLLVVGVITLTHLGVGYYMYRSISEFAGKLADFVPDLEADVQYFRGWMLRYMLLTVVTTFLAIILLSLYFSARISGPLYNMSRIFRHAARGDYTKRIVLRRGDELREFSDVSNVLLQSLEDRHKKVSKVLGELRQGGKPTDENLRLLEESLAVDLRDET